MNSVLGILKLCLSLLSSDKQDQGPQQGGGQDHPGHSQSQSQPQPQHQPQPSYPPQHPSFPSHHGGELQLHKPNKYQGHFDANQQNQANPHYTGLRDRARHEGDEMARCFGEGHRAYEEGDGARAKELSNQGKRHKAEMERLNKEASDWVFYQNNTDSAPDEVDLHGLYVAEAIERTENAIQQAHSAGRDHLNIIVGKGLHSPQHVAKLKPAIEDLMQKYNLAAEPDPHNSGVLVVQLGQGERRGMGSDEITRRLDSDQECIIM